MRYATAIWNYWTPDTSLAELVEEFAGFGYDTISFSTAQLKTLEPRQLRDHSGGRRELHHAVRGAGLLIHLRPGDGI